MSWHFIEVDEHVFSLDVVLKATYWLSGRYTIDIRRDPAKALTIIAARHADRPLTAEESAELEVRLRRELIDFRTRAIVEQETRTVRELLVAKAFAHGDER